MPIDRPKRSSDLVYDPEKQRYVERSGTSRPRKSQKSHEPPPPRIPRVTRVPQGVKGWLGVYALFLIYQTGMGIFGLIQNIGHVPAQRLIFPILMLIAYAFAIYSLKYIGQAWVRVVHLILNGYPVLMALPFLIATLDELLNGNLNVFTPWIIFIVAHFVWIVLWLYSPRVKQTRSVPEYPGAPKRDEAPGEASPDSDTTAGEDGSGSQSDDLKSYFTVGRVISFVISIPMIIGAIQIYNWGESYNSHLFTLIAGLPLFLLGVTIFIAGLLGKNGAAAAFGVFGVILRLLIK